MTSSLLWCMARDNGGTGSGAVGCMPVVVCGEHASHLPLRTLERQSLCESHRQRRWLTHWSYLQSLVKEGVQGMRLGVVRQLFMPQNTDPEVMQRMEQALADLRRLGAQL